MANRWGNSGNSVRLYFWGAPKSLQMVTAAMKLKDAYSLGRKVMTNLDSIFKSRDITFLPRSKRLLISWLHSPSAVILEPPKLKSDTVSPSISHEVMGPDAIIYVF